MAPYASANPYGATQMSGQVPDLRAPMGVVPLPLHTPGAAPLEMLPAAVGGFSVPPQAHAPVLVDVTPRALVVEVVGGYCDTIIARNAKIPCERTRQFTTGTDYQTVVRVRVAQGEHAQFMQNTYLGEVELSGIRPATRGEVQIGVTFELDADGSLRVRAKDVATGQEAIATLQLVGLASDESSIVMMIDRMAQQQIAR
jgi:molecular chaperone DnaK